MQCRVFESDGLCGMLEPITSFTTDAEGLTQKTAVFRLRCCVSGWTARRRPARHSVLALQTKLTLDAGEEKCVVFVLGQAHTKEAERP